MYEITNTKTAEGYDTSTEKIQPALIALTERFQNAVNKFDGLTCQLTIKLQKIKRYSEEPNLKIEVPDENQSESFVEEMHKLICRVEEYNARLEFNLRHLNEIV